MLTKIFTVREAIRRLASYVIALDAAAGTDLGPIP
jgi:hypothetical protein